jgi:type IV pilus assembly protein PilB
MRTGRSKQHWLVTLVTEGGCTQLDSLEVAPGSSTAATWAVVARACGIDDDDLAKRVAARFQLPVANLEIADRRALRLVPEKVARRYRVFPLREDDQRLVVATSDPLDLDLEEALRFASGRRPVFEIAAPRAIQEALDARYSPAHSIEHLLERVEPEILESVRLIEYSEPEAVIAQEVESGPVVKLTNLIIRDAIREGASDVHIEPETGGGAVRFRVDGVLRHRMKLPIEALNRIVSRIKIVGSIDIADRLRPHDGRARVQVDGRIFDLRISTVPTRDSEKAVIRLLDPQGTRGLNDLGLPEREVARVRHVLTHRDGIVVVTGPTGSGKTTTVYGAIREMATGERNIMSVEEPVEYELGGVTQIQVDPRRGVTFASGLRAILRQDPDVIFVGEIRDLETAEIAVQAAMTGHLVLATLHTNDAVSAVARLHDIGLEHASIAATFRGALAQRLLRRVCSRCAVPLAGALSEEENRLASVFGVEPVVRAVGCSACGQTGYRGRIPVSEVLEANWEIQSLILKRCGTAELERAAAAAGMRTLRLAALARVQAGETTLQEVERVLGEATEESRAKTESPRILVVDDDPVNRALVRKVLERSDFQVAEAADGLAALERLESAGDCDLVVLDLQMPRLSGPEVLSRLKRSVSTAGIPVVVLTGTEETGTEAELLEMGAEDYIRKPIDPTRFLARIRAALRRVSETEGAGWVFLKPQAERVRRIG